jgi:nanoRNase/pAp phosphatase (c-di-AMP/oligoRNAs hydrolase)
MYFNNDVTSETLMVGARLIEKGADFRKVIYEMFQKKSFMQMKLWKYLLENLRQESNGQISYSFISKDNIREL